MAAIGTSRIRAHANFTVDADYQLAELITHEAGDERGTDAQASVAQFAVEHHYYADYFSVMYMLLAKDERLSATGRAHKALLRRDHVMLDELAHDTRWAVVLTNVDAASGTRTRKFQRIAGFACYNLVTPGQLTLMYMFVAPVHRRKALGTRLLRILEFIATRERCTSIAVEAEASSLEALCFYARRGFTVAPFFQSDVAPMVVPAPGQLELLNATLYKWIDRPELRRAKQDELIVAATAYLCDTTRATTLAEFERRYGALLVHTAHMRTLWFTLRLSGGDGAHK